jgi:hypothetical protein
MQSVPNYQIVEFLDWLKQNQRNIDLQSEKLEKLASIYLQDFEYNRTRFDLRFILEIFQICPQIGERDIMREMEHFVKCGECLHYIFRRKFRERVNFPKVTLHPLLERFLFFLKEKEFHRSNMFERDMVDFREPERIHDIFKHWIRENGEELLLHFRKYIEKTDESIISDFERKNRKESRHRLPKEKEERNGEINVSNCGLENEAHRLAYSVRYLLSDERNLQNPELLGLYSSIFGDDYSKTLEFFNWIIQKYPNLNLTSDIPSNKLSDLIDQFCEDYSYSDINSFKKQVEKIFRGELDGNLLDKVRKWFRGRGENIDYSKNPFNRYSQMKFHGVFLFPNFGSSDLIKFIDESWQDLNSLTGDFIDVYYSKEDIKKRNGFDILKDFKSFNNIKLTDLPSLIIWDSTLKNALALPLSDLNNNQIFMVVQHIVQAIKDDKELKGVGNTGMDFINLQLDKRIPKQIQYIMGDKFEFNNAKNFIFVNKSNVENSFNKIKEQFDEETANVIKQIAEIVEKSSNVEAVDLFDAFNEEVNKPEPKKSLLKSFWTGLTAALPVLTSTASIVEKVMKMIN